ncbi:MAG: iron-sulfur cluster assembly scaffold protein [Planctomycetaceae bacterium]|nr:iron-sulfur cluster assembly scaffold protein [Planctomycetaceae bacterium]
MTIDPQRNTLVASCERTGCIISRAAASILCEHLTGQTLDEAIKLTARDMLDLMRVPLLPRRRQCALLAWQAWQELIPQLAEVSRKMTPKWDQSAAS